MAEVKLEHVYKVYDGGVTAVEDANLIINDKEFMVLVGPSGCGKSTSLRMIAGLEEITKGTVLIDDRVVNDVPPKDRDIAMVFQNYALYPHMSVYKNMAFGLKLRKFPKTEIDKRVRDAAHILGITEYLERKPKALSGGQRQRVAVGRAIVRQPKAFLFDEPLSNLDAKMRVQMRAEISKLHKTLQSTMIYVTHDQVEAMTMGDRICVMKDGIIQQVASPLDLYENPANQFVAGFIGSPPMNLFNGTIEKRDGIHFNEGTFSVKVDDAHAAVLSGFEGQKVVFGLRPEELSDIKFVSESIPESQLSAGVDAAEQMGSEVFLYLNTGNNSFIARVNSHQAAAQGDKITLQGNMPKAHYFELETGKIII